jgi:exosortase
MTYSSAPELAEHIPAAAVPAPASRTPLWQVVMLAVLVAILYYSVLARLGQAWWNDPNFSHGFFVPLFSLFVMWQEWSRIAATAVRPSSWGTPIVIASLAMLIVGTLGAELFLSRCSLIFLLAGLIVCFYGWACFCTLLFPWACLFLMVPIPAIVFNQITFPLQFLASEVSASMLRALGVPVLREGNVIRLPVMPLEVAEACSGIRSLVSLGTLAVIYGYLLEKKTWNRLALVIAAVPIAVFANGLRITGTGLVAQYWDPARAEGFFHEFSGWVLFLLSLGMLFSLHRLMHLAGRWRTGWRRES